MSEPSISLSRIDPNLQVAEFEARAGRSEAYARVIVVRVTGAAASKPGDRYIVQENGDLIGFVGGGCIRGAVKRAGRDAIATGETRLVRAVPKARLEGAVDTDGINLVANGCPSEGEIEFFVEPVLPQPPLIVLGRSGLADAIAELGSFAGLAVYRDDEKASLPASIANGFWIVASQGEADFAALSQALASDCPHIFFVASRKKAAHLRTRLSDAFEPVRLENIISPAGLDIGARSPAEIAISIISQIISLRRKAETTE